MGRLEIFLNDSLGTFTSAAPIETGAKSPTAIVTGEFDDDQTIDVAVAHLGDVRLANNAGDVRVMLGLGDGRFSSGNAYRVGAIPASIDRGDLNGDGLQDLVAVSFASDTATILLGDGAGQFSISSQQLSTGSGPVQVTVIDVDDDQDSDILVSNLKSRSVTILRNRISQLTDPDGSIAFEAAESRCRRVLRRPSTCIRRRRFGSVGDD
ncbi:MAG: VCBS repeat-containing protein [Pirellulaceae bacterium]